MEDAQDAVNYGSSPQARGTRNVRCRTRAILRLIPAGAENTSASVGRFSSRAAHPRRRGEHGRRNSATRSNAGSSPQARGTQNLALIADEVSRLIPAGAGNTRRSGMPRAARAAHPRRRGEHSRVRPTPPLPPGSSPQARGTPDRADDVARPVRLIPAGAGNTRRSGMPRAARAAHPRRRGEHSRVRPTPPLPPGSSPQARGTPDRADDVARPVRLIPAGAGNTRAQPHGFRPLSAHPRRRGEHGLVSDARLAEFGSSPQARGTPVTVYQDYLDQRLIPAGAGNTEPRRSAR